MGEVVELDVWTRLDIPAERVLSKAIEADLDDVFVLGIEKDGKLYFASTTANREKIVYNLERAKRFVFEIDGE